MDLAGQCNLGQLTATSVGRRRLAVGLVASVLLAALGTVASPIAFASADSTSPWIVELRDGAVLADVLRSAEKRLGVKPMHEYNHLLRGFSANLTSGQRERLLADPRVAAVIADATVRATGDPEAQPGVRRVGSVQNPDRSGALDVDIAILDTGIQTNNPDLNVVGGYNCTNTGQPSSYGDSPSFGHGTHVAGIAAARNNGSGVEGVAAGARLWSIKVLDWGGLGYCHGSSATSTEWPTWAASRS